MSDLPHLPARSDDSHKGDYGRALLVGGSRGMTGAIALAGLATLRSGAGLVTLAVPDRCLETVAAFDPCYMTVPLPDDEQGRLVVGAQTKLSALGTSATAWACGPGLGRSESLRDLVRRLYMTVTQPMVVDADALNALAAHPDGLSQPGGPRIVTPHPGEFDRLCPLVQPTGEQREDRARALAREHELIVVLKGRRTLVTDGRQAWHNQTGNPGMATGGSGDVLTGVVTALLCQGLDPWDAARLGVHVHGRAGDLAAVGQSMVAMTALDIVAALPAAWSEQR